MAFRQVVLQQPASVTASHSRATAQPVPLSPPFQGSHGQLPATPCLHLESDTYLPLMALKSRIPSAGPQIWTKSSRDIFSKSAPRQ